MNIVSISDGIVSWQDKQLQNRSSVNASTENIHPSYLHLKIMACDVNDTADQGMYHCELFAYGKKIGSVGNRSEIKNLTITGLPEKHQEYCGTYVHSLARNAKGYSIFLVIHAAVFIFNFTSIMMA